MMLNSLYDIAANSEIPVVDMKLKAFAMSVMDDDLECIIGIDLGKIMNPAQEKVCLAHELGHCFKGAFYNRYSKLDIISRHEYRADKWAIQHIIERVELETAIERGNTELWQLAEYFDVTEEFMQKAVDYYENERLADG